MIFDFTDKVVLLPEALTLPEVKQLRLSDRTAGKKYFDMWITYIYFVYRNQSIYSNMFITTRKRMTCVNQLGRKEDYWKEIEQNKKVMALIGWYVKYSKTKEEQLLDALDADIEQYLSYLKDIKYSNSIRIEEKVGDDGEVKIGYRSEDNSDEKMKAIKNSKDLIQYRKDLKKLVRETSRKKAGKQTRTRDYES